MGGPRGPYSTLLIDWGGVLTSSIYDAFEAFAVEEQLSGDVVRRAFREDDVARELLVEVECGRLAPDQFDIRLCAVLGLRGERADGMMDRMLAGVRVNPAMLQLVRGLRAQAIRVALVSNSWTRDHYDHAVLDQDFDLVILSTEVGARKPEAAIYHMTLERLGATPQECVFVDDLGGNLRYPRQLGMATLLHENEQRTRRLLEELFGVAIDPPGRRDDSAT